MHRSKSLDVAHIALRFLTCTLIEISCAICSSYFPTVPKKVHVPEPELYMIFTGERVRRPETISLSKEFFDGKECAIEVKVKVLYGGQGNDIISQYVAFTKVYNEQVKQYGRSREAVTETIRICKDRDVLREFLAGRRLYLL